jgi:transposase
VDDERLRVLTLARPDLRREEARQALLETTGRTYSLSTISRRWRTLGFTHKRLRKYARNRDEQRRVNFWVNPPDNLPRGVAGVFGVPTWSMIDIDECGIQLQECDRTFGHAPKGRRAMMPGWVCAEAVDFVNALNRFCPPQPSRTNTKFNLLLAIDTLTGPVAWWIYPANTDANVFAFFVTEYLLPRLTAGVQRTVLWDNLSAHFTGDVATNALAAAGHRVVARPSYSPDMAPIESAFSKVKNVLRRCKDRVTAANLRQQIDAAVQTITPRDCQGWYQDCHYFVPGRQFRPYLGMPGV